MAIVGAGVLGPIFGSLFMEKGPNVTPIEVNLKRVGVTAKRPKSIANMKRRDESCKADIWGERFLWILLPAK
jgi:hypothetical protein